ncbi:hypothetical protein QVD17_41050 [Tagetes erecta]|uniref:Uncharacterized protein n=1 Tax=Tagetes erecta TaxID=13708 RepID=A0AAD8JQH8_TARER|nr:hypothetical protein QVD17_41050 [Tagetes erecta]
MLPPTPSMAILCTLPSPHSTIIKTVDIAAVAIYLRRGYNIQISVFDLRFAISMPDLQTFLSHSIREFKP